MKVAMMQPYLFPYIGYFQLVKAVDVFIFADDVNFIKGGFINRNRILLQNKEYYFVVPCNKSQNKLINEVNISTQIKGYPQSLLLTVKQAYSKAPFFKDVFPIIESVFNSGSDNISALATSSVESVSKYLEIKVDFRFSSESFSHTRGQEKSIRLTNITKELGFSTYINPSGGKNIYSKKYFESLGVKLEILETEDLSYAQFNDNFIPNLSIIDVIMLNSKENCNKLLTKYGII